MSVMLFIYNINFPFTRFVKLRKTVHQLNFFSCVKECLTLHIFNGFTSETCSDLALNFPFPFRVCG